MNFTSLNFQLAFAVTLLHFAVKGIFSDFHNIFYGMNQKISTKRAYFQNFSWYQFYVFKLCMIICDPTRANEALWGRYQNCHFKLNLLFNIYGTLWYQNNFHIIFLAKVINNLISNCLITLKINYQDMGKQSYWFVYKPIEDIKNNWIKTSFPVTYWLVWVHELIEFMSKFVFKQTLIFEKFWPYFTFLLITQN